MKIQYASDLHLEFKDNRSFCLKNPLQPVGDVLVLAGDICYLDDKHFQFDFFNYVADNWEQVILIPGNHEFYNHSFDIDKAVLDFEYEISSNVKYVNNHELLLGEHRILFSTLWTHIVRQPQLIEESLNDFYESTYKGRAYGYKDHNSSYFTSLDFLGFSLSNKNIGGKTVVVTHYVPFSHTYCDYDFDPFLHEGFHIDLSGLMRLFKIDYWIYGHNHHFNEPFQLEGTTLVTNQLGYVMRNEHYNFDRSAIIEL